MASSLRRNHFISIFSWHQQKTGFVANQFIIVQGVQECDATADAMKYCSKVTKLPLIKS